VKELDEIAEMVLDEIRCACTAKDFSKAHKLLEQIMDLVLRGIAYVYVWQAMNPGMTINVFLDRILIAGETSKI